MNISSFTRFIIARENIRLKKEAGVAPPLTNDPILASYRFTNIRREDDTVTKWVAKYVRTQQSPILACTAFRWWNRIRTGEQVFLQLQLDGRTAWESYLVDPTPRLLSDAIRLNNQPPYVTGVYIIKTPAGMDKVDGTCWCVDQVRPYVKKMEQVITLWDAFDHLSQAPYMGSFTAGQVIADIKFLSQFRQSPDFDTFAVSGPGSRKGLNIMMGRDPDKSWNEDAWYNTLLEVRYRLGPIFDDLGWERLSAQDVQNCLCELSKYHRGFGKQRYRTGT